MVVCAFGQHRGHSRACNAEPLGNLLVREPNFQQLGGTFTALLAKSLLLFSRFSDSRGICSPRAPITAAVL